MSVELRVTQSDAQTRINKVRVLLMSLSNTELKQIAREVGVSISGLYRFRKGDQKTIGTEAWIRLESLSNKTRKSELGNLQKEM